MTTNSTQTHEQLKTQLLEVMRTNAIDIINVEYNQTDDDLHTSVDAYRNDEAIDITDIDIPFGQHSRFYALPDALEEFISDLLMFTPDGLTTTEHGGHGDLLLDATKATVTLTHHARHVEMLTSTVTI